MREAVRLFLKRLARILEREGLGGNRLTVSPMRAASCSPVCRSSPADVLRSTSTDTDELVLAKDIELYSVCEHHLLCLTAWAHVGYIPAKDGVMG